jgi:oligopeptide/dipeptide ABC transporter ATP-binding protein
MTEAVIAHGTMNRRDATTLAVELLTAVQISNPADRLNRFPHELSGGMLQRVMIASALMGSPRLLLADEPTTSLDVTTQAEVMAILDELRRDRGLAMVFITHDLELAAAVCDRTAVMYAGQIVEVNTSRDIEHDPLHPYTFALLRSRPRIDATLPRLEAIPGQPLSSFEVPDNACAFTGRCPHATEVCRTTSPPIVAMESGASRCFRVDELRGTLHGVEQ